MTTTRYSAPPAPSQAHGSACLSPEDSPVDLSTVLAAWQAATERLQMTHESLRTEVRRLTTELEIKNRELARKNRLADLGQMASHIAHEVRNSLVPLTLYMGLLRRRVSDDSDNIDVLDKIQAGLTSLEVTVNDLLHFTSEREPELRWFELRPLLEEICKSVAPQLAAQEIAIDIDAPAGLGLVADRDMLRRALLNLVLNALDAMPDGGELSMIGCLDRFGLVLEVADSGPGLSDDVRQHAFEPFFTTKGTGTGLGLAIVYRIAEVHGGEVTAANCAQGGAAFTIRIPQHRLEAAA
jgi:signal transduction histidine kinase